MGFDGVKCLGPDDLPACHVRQSQMNKQCLKQRASLHHTLLSLMTRPQLLGLTN